MSISIAPRTAQNSNSIFHATPDKDEQETDQTTLNNGYSPGLSSDEASGNALSSMGGLSKLSHQGVGTNSDENHVDRTKRSPYVTLEELGVSLSEPTYPQMTRDGLFENVHRVDDHVIRGSRPRPGMGRDLEYTQAHVQALIDIGVTQVISYHEGENPAGLDRLRAAGINFIHHRIDDRTPVPGLEHVYDEVMRNPNPGITYIHCAAGIDRTGAAVIAYQIGAGQINSQEQLEVAMGDISSQGAQADTANKVYSIDARNILKDYLARRLATTVEPPTTTTNMPTTSTAKSSGENQMSDLNRFTELGMDHGARKKGGGATKDSDRPAGTDTSTTSDQHNSVEGMKAVEPAGSVPTPKTLLAESTSFTDFLKNKELRKEVYDGMYSNYRSVYMADGIRLTPNDGWIDVFAAKNSNSGPPRRIGKIFPVGEGDFTYKPEGPIISPTSLALDEARKKYPALKGAALPPNLNWENTKKVSDSDGYTSSGEWFNSFRSYSSVNQFAEGDSVEQPTVRYFSGDNTLVVPFVNNGNGEEETSYGYMAFRDGEVVGYSASNARSQKIDTKTDDPIYPSDPLHHQSVPFADLDNLDLGKMSAIWGAFFGSLLLIPKG